MKNTLSMVFDGLALLIGIDLIIVFVATLQIMAGISTPHIAFWDAQIRFIVNSLM